MSLTVTDLAAVVVLPLASVAVTVTDIAPRSVQLNVLGDTESDTSEQLSVAELTN